MHYTRALDVLAQLPDTVENRQRRVDTHIKQVASSFLADSPEKNLARLVEAEQLVHELPVPDGMPDSNRVRLARVHYWLGRIHRLRHEFPEALLYYSQVLPVAEEIGDPELLGIPSMDIGQTLLVQGRAGQAEPLLRRAMTALQQTGSLLDQVRALIQHGMAIAMLGDYAVGVAQMQRALARAHEMGSVPLTCLGQIHLASCFNFVGDPQRAMEAARKATEAAEESGDQMSVYWGRGFLAWGEAGTGQFEAAEATMAQSQAIAQELGGQLLMQDVFLAARAEIALGMGRIQEALDLAERAVVMAQGMGSLGGGVFGSRVWGQALARLDPQRWDEAEARFARCLRLIESAPSPPQAAHTHLIWGTVCRDRGDLDAAREHWEEAAALSEACGIAWQVEKARALIATLPEV
jgi:tetratricopeptide (TPR) repeat protein